MAAAPYSPGMLSTAAEAARSGRAKGTGTRSRYRDNLACHLIGISRDLESRVRHALGEECGFRGLRPSSRSFLTLIWGEGRALVGIAMASRSVGVLPLIAERIQCDLMQTTTARGHAGLKMSHGQVLPLIGPEGERMVEIARIQRVSRQAIRATTQDLEDLGYLRREPDPRDRRGVVLRLRRRGQRLIEDSVSAVDDLESAFREVLGERRLAHLQRVARDLYDALRLEAEIFETGTDPRAASKDIDARNEKRGGREILPYFPFKTLSDITRVHAAHHVDMSHGNYATLTMLYDWIFGTYEAPVSRPTP